MTIDMRRQSFTPKNIRNSARNLRREFGDPEIGRASHRVARDIQNGTVAFGTLSEVRSNARTTYVFQDLYSRLLANRISENIRIAYQIKPANRNLIVDQITTLLKEGAPFTIYKLDLRSFFESIPRTDLISNLQRDLLLSAETRNLLEKLFDHSVLRRIPGLPLGVSVSAPLSEYVVRDLDHWVRRRPGVYYYARFVDDLLIFSLSDDGLTEDLEKWCEILNLSINWDKCVKQTIRCALAIDDTGAPPGTRCYPLCRCKENHGNPLALDYLGYRFQFTDTPSNSKSGKNVKITIAPKKIKTIKTRLARSVVDYSFTGDFALLRDRLRLLTGCYPVVSRPWKSNLLGGIPYNYSRMTNYESLEDLDHYKNSLLFAYKGNLGKRLDALLTNRMRRYLAQISFVHSYKHRLTWSFTRDRIYNIKRCFPR